jgi:hypothetical protein
MISGNSRRMLERTAEVTTWRDQVNTGAELNIRREASHKRKIFLKSKRKKKSSTRVIYGVVSCNLLPYTAECNKNVSPASYCLHIYWITAVDTTFLVQTGVSNQCTNRLRANVLSANPSSRAVWPIRAPEWQIGGMCPRSDSLSKALPLVLITI